LLIPSPTPLISNRCSACGFTSEDVRKTGRLGCGECYVIFSGLLQDVLNDCQKGTRHAGKVPKSFRKPSKKRLQEDLSSAVGKEEFEEAARLRDELGKIGEDGWGQRSNFGDGADGAVAFLAGFDEAGGGELGELGKVLGYLF